MTLTTRRRFVSGAPAFLGVSAILSACSQGSDAEGYEAVVRRTWRLGPLEGFEGAALSKELVRYATLAPSTKQPPAKAGGFEFYGLKVRIRVG